MRTLSAFPERLRLGFVGGGLGSGIGTTHRYAAQLDGHYHLVAGCFSTDPARNAEIGRVYGVAPERVYPTFAAMAAQEAERPDGIDVVSIMTPNDLHVSASRAFIERGIDVICDKPLGTDLADALALEQTVRGRDNVFVLTHNYSGFPMVREARAQIAAGAIGEVRVIQVEHAASLGVELLEQQGVRRMAWRTDTASGGASPVLADVGVHAHHLMRFVTGMTPAAVSADLATLLPGRTTDDNAHIMLRFKSGARGMLWASFVAAGHRQGLQLRVFGSTGSLAWDQEDPERLVIKPQHAPHFVLRRGEPWLSADADASTRVKAGQVEGMIEAFANIYADAAELIRQRRGSAAASQTARLCPGIGDGIAGMQFMHACLHSHRSDSAWVDIAP